MKSKRPWNSEEPTPYASTGTAARSKSADLLDGEPARDDDLDVLESLGVEGAGRSRPAGGRRRRAERPIWGITERSTSISLVSSRTP